jgi:secreted PhoX family phosphatase
MSGARQGGVSRRNFLGGAAAAGGAAWASSLQLFMTQRAHGRTERGSPYGGIGPVNDKTTGLPLLLLPKGFEYQSFGWTGEMMSDGVRTPGLHDGMVVVASRKTAKGTTELVLVRNHEEALGPPFADNPAITFDADGAGAGGTTNLTFDLTRGRFGVAWSSLAGTYRNCAGGVTPWGTWLTCEEASTIPGHGYVFEVGAETGDPNPLRAMGRFSHEALAVDPDGEIVYLTEDENNSGFYRFIPNVKGKLAKGGRLEMLAVRGQPNFDFSPAGAAPAVGTRWRSVWVPVENPDPDFLNPDPARREPTVYAQGRAGGGARFRRLEGAWTGADRVYFLSTDGGQVGEGQVFEFDPTRQVLTLIYDSPSYQECENPDNIVVTPRGGLLLQEDNAGAPPGPPNPGERLLGLTLEGRIFEFARNNIVLTQAINPRIPAGNYTQNEWAGACYSPDGEWLFVNIQTPGVTFAIRGPWDKGPL